MKHYISKVICFLSTLLPSLRPSPLKAKPIFSVGSYTNPSTFSGFRFCFKDTKQEVYRSISWGLNSVDQESGYLGLRAAHCQCLSDSFFNKSVCHVEPSKLWDFELWLFLSMGTTDVFYLCAY